MRVPRGVIYLLIVAVALTLLPLAVIALARTSTSSKPRIHIVPDMDSQESFKAQQGSTLFSDGRAARLAPAGTVARGQLKEDDHYYRGKIADAYATEFPKQVQVTEELLLRGKNRFQVFCAPCHGRAGYGDGMVARHADALAEGTWTQPADFHTDAIRQRPVGEIFDILTNGVRNMPAHGRQIKVHDRWAIVAYAKALQLSQEVDVESLPAEFRQGLR